MIVVSFFSSMSNFQMQSVRCPLLIYIFFHHFIFALLGFVILFVASLCWNVLKIFLFDNIDGNRCGECWRFQFLVLFHFKHLKISREKNKFYYHQSNLNKKLPLNIITKKIKHTKSIFQHIKWKEKIKTKKSKKIRWRWATLTM